MSVERLSPPDAVSSLDALAAYCRAKRWALHIYEDGTVSVLMGGGLWEHHGQSGGEALAKALAWERDHGE